MIALYGIRTAAKQQVTNHKLTALTLYPTVGFYLQLATGGDANAVALTDAYDWYILPVMNPDGYAYTWSNVRR